MAWKEEGEPVEFSAKVMAKSEKAVLVSIEGEEMWIPFSQIKSDRDFWENAEKGDEGDLLISEWIAGEKGLV